MGKRVTVALVMPVRNEERAVEETLSAVLASTRLPDECVIADGMSSDRTAEKIRAFQNRGLQIRVVPNPTVFCGGGRNRAIEQTNCEVIVIADFGNRVDPKWIENIVRPFEEQKDVDVVGGMFRPWIRSDFEHCMAAIHYFEDYTLDQYSEEERERLLPEVLAPGGMCIAHTRRIWERAKGFPEWLAKGQDKLFSRKIHALGGRIAVAWDAIVHHHIRSTPGQVFKQLFLYGRGNGQMRYVSEHFFKLIGFYGLLLCLLVYGFVFNVAWIVALALSLAYYWHSGISKVRRIRARPWKTCYLWLTALALFARDFGTIAGHVFGWAEWIFQPRYRRLFREYTQDCPQKSLKVIAR